MKHLHKLGNHIGAYCTRRRPQKHRLRIVRHFTHSHQLRHILRRHGAVCSPFASCHWIIPGRPADLLPAAHPASIARAPVRRLPRRKYSTSISGRWPTLPDRYTAKPFSPLGMPCHY